MIYLILDTNIWLYLANGIDPISNQTDRQHENLHFKLLAQLKELKEKGDISILVNDIIIEEWKRNKEHCNIKIKKLTRKLEDQRSVLSEIKKYVQSNTDEIQEEYIEGIQRDIKENEEHIQNVEDFLFNECTKIDISEELKIRIFNLSVSKKVPFHNKRNNIADAAILFSAVSYVNREAIFDESAAIFVSNNIEDFTDGKNTEDFHPDLKGHVDQVRFERILPKALKVSKDIILQIEEYNNYQKWLETVSFSCRTPYCEGHEDFSPWGYLDTQATVKFKSQEIDNSDQLELFEEIPRLPKKNKTVGIGSCVVCETLHIECPECNELIYVEDPNEEFECDYCNTKMEIDFVDPDCGVCIHVNDITDEEY